MGLVVHQLAAARDHGHRIGEGAGGDVPVDGFIDACEPLGGHADCLGAGGGQFLRRGRRGDREAGERGKGQQAVLVIHLKIPGKVRASPRGWRGQAYPKAPAGRCA